MKRLLAPLLLAPLVACGALGPASPTTAQLLSAPTTLTVAGRSLTAEASPSISGAVFRVQVQVQSPRPPLPPLTVTDVYVVTREGVWRSGVAPGSQRACAGACTFAVGRGAARGMVAGTGSQVVVALRDPLGRSYLLRDDTVRVR